MRNVTPIVVLLALAGCVQAAHFEPYYEDQSDPEIIGVDPASEEGNGGGTLVTITGSGFGDDPSDIVVQFGRHNAEIYSVSDSAIEVYTPKGPITGGPVDILVATPTGYTECIPPGTSGYDSGCSVDYTYDVGTLSGDSDFYTGQEHFLLIHNLWYSCYGGMYDNPSIGGCDTIAYFGQTGLDGIGESSMAQAGRDVLQPTILSCTHHPARLRSRQRCQRRLRRWARTTARSSAPSRAKQPAALPAAMP